MCVFCTVQYLVTPISFWLQHAFDLGSLSVCLFFLSRLSRRSVSLVSSVRRIVRRAVLVMKYGRYWYRCVVRRGVMVMKCGRYWYRCVGVLLFADLARENWCW